MITDTTKDTRRKCLDGARDLIRASRAYRLGEHIPGLTYEVKGNRDFANQMWEACMKLARENRMIAKVL